MDNVKIQPGVVCEIVVSDANSKYVHTLVNVELCDSMGTARSRAALFNAGSGVASVHTVIHSVVAAIKSVNPTWMKFEVAYTETMVPVGIIEKKQPVWK